MSKAESRAAMCTDQRDAALEEVRSLNAMLISAKESLAETHDPACELQEIREFLRVEYGESDLEERGGTVRALKKCLSPVEALQSEECERLRKEIAGLKKIIRLNMEVLTTGSKRRRPPP